jgi:hypothetical protein
MSVGANDRAPAVNGTRRSGPSSASASGDAGVRVREILADLGQLCAQSGEVTGELVVLRLGAVGAPAGFLPGGLAGLERLLVGVT